jgi:hypothetical protein
MQMLMKSFDDDAIADQNQLLRIICLLLLAILLIGGTYVYFNPWHTDKPKNFSTEQI